MSQVNISTDGRKLDIGGIQLYYECFGIDNGHPTLVFDSGYGGTTDNWNSIRSEISKTAMMFIYDRAGIGESEQDERPRHSQQNVENLRLLLQKANVKPPYLLIGHSYGGINVRLFASTYPDEVAGVILVDSSHEDQNTTMVPLFTKEIQEDYYGGFGYESTLREFEESMDHVRAHKSLGTLPLIVMTGGTQHFHTPESMSVWVSFQQELAELSSTSKHIIVGDAGHSIHIDCPQAVIDAIHEMLEMVARNAASKQQPLPTRVNLQDSKLPEA